MVAAQVDIVIPWQRGQGEDRRTACRMVEFWLEGELEQFDATVRRGVLAYGRPWCKAAAVARALDGATAPVLVVHDADVLVEPGALVSAITAVQDGAPWAMPHGTVRRLTERSSELVYSGWPLTGGLSLAERAYRGVAGGGVVVLPRVTYDDVPLDPRFVGWGQEDTSWSKALRVLAGEPVRFDGTLWHLWHEPQRRDSRRYGSPNSRALAERYRLALRSPAAMRQLVEDGKAAA